MTGFTAIFVLSVFSCGCLKIYAQTASCAELKGRCLPHASDIFCDGTRDNDIPGCSSQDYCCVPHKTKTCASLGGQCMNVKSALVCGGEEVQGTPDCGQQGLGNYCCVRKDVQDPPMEACERMGGRCQSLLSALACGGDRDSSQCGDSTFTFCCYPPGQ
ncbi:uncharacterized protein [Haliotis asinina]|uniref:uncharacterized protein n=1 Tax=Haliotis asinina TaxID=109174 RepID=UPI0035320FA7